MKLIHVCFVCAINLLSINLKSILKKQSLNSKFMAINNTSGKNM